MKDWFKKNNKKAIIWGIVIITFILLIVFVYGIITFLIPNSKESVYGERCEITENVPLEDNKQEKIETFMKDYKGFKVVSVQRKCNLVDVIVEVDDKTKLANVKSMGKKLLTQFTAEELDVYDIQLMVRSNNESSAVYPVIGTHHKKVNGKTNGDFIW